MSRSVKAGAQLGTPETPPGHKVAQVHEAWGPRARIGVLTHGFSMFEAPLDITVKLFANGITLGVGRRESIELFDPFLQIMVDPILGKGCQVFSFGCLRAGG